MKTITTMLRGDKKNKKGQCPIVFYIDRERIVTGEKCLPNDWKEQKVKAKVAGAEVINMSLERKRAALRDILTATSDINEVRDKFKEYLENPESLSRIISERKTLHTGFGQVIDEIITEGRLKENYQRGFRRLQKKMARYDSEFNALNLTRKYWSTYVAHCSKAKPEGLGNSQNTIAADAKLFKKAVKHLRGKGYQLSITDDDLKESYHDPKILPLTWNQVKDIANLDLSDKSSDLNNVRTLFLVGCYTGRRWSEVLNMTRHSFPVTAGRMRYTGAAKGNKIITVPLIKDAIDYLTSIKFKIPSGIKPGKVNDLIKKIEKLAGINEDTHHAVTKNGKTKDMVSPMYELVHFHTSRHTFAVHITELSASLPNSDKWTSEMLGHASANVTWKYRNLSASNVDAMLDQVEKGTQ